MRKLLPISVVALLGALTFSSSCSKSSSDPTGNYTCRCTYTLAGVSDSFSAPYTNQKKSSVQTICDQEKTQLTTTGATNVSCAVN